ncbi:hypothetical protein [Halomarina pelagica]|uniref:hypothetical protein n=1 Tax=Halomarina pelagica TaxID=2961599 RepID=UPI0020C2D650|nr:hypothetical protein [Halomarina sp. BND7]
MNDGGDVSIDCKAKLDQGTIEFTLWTPTEEVLWEQTGRSFEAIQRVSIERSGTYRFVIQGAEAVGQFELSWTT